ncbi:hypothetical protein ACFVH6_42970 [Spirillospora sp. NPDC127200]
MTDHITCVVPDQTTACFVVAADREPAALPSAPGPFTAEAARRLGGPTLMITTYRAADSPWDLRPCGKDGRLVARVCEATRHIGVTAALPVADQPFGGRLARAMARAIAREVRGVAVDADTGQVLDRPTEQPRFALADDWLGAWLPPYRDNGRCTAPDDEIDGCACVQLTSRGLRRFGLPELRVSGVSCPHDLAALNVLRTTAQRLLPLGARPGAHTVPREISLTSGDFASYWGTHDPMWDDGPVTVRLTELRPRLLRIDPPARYPGTLNEWLWDELPSVMYELLHCDPDLAAA